MNCNGMGHVLGQRTLDWDRGQVLIIDQTRLPADEVVLRLDTVAELVEAIARLAVRGAMALGVAGALGVALAARAAEAAGEDVQRATEEAARQLIAVRPTAANLSWGVERALAASAGGADAVLAEALRIRDADVEANRRIGELGADVLAGSSRLLTHCNAGALAAVEWGSALATVRVLHERAGPVEVLVSETRPLLQGARLTAWELARMGIAHQVIVDGAGAGLILGGRVDAVIVGADRIAANGDVANKVGTLPHALAAAHADVPFVVAAPEATIDLRTPTGADIEIEEHEPEEILVIDGRRTAPPGTGALNPAFDVTPAALVTAIVTEQRVLRPALGERPDAASPEPRPGGST
ncbi:MAG: S-methyl-5-thioribose-1-phosphate isomerase [Solirubrobacteraceae bacterium]